jgi:UDP:flavonoid glycosyltransferase YjiC (YdhE family)
MILAHEATGAFIIHCGWNSVQESVAAGVSMIALPLQSDQPIGHGLENMGYFRGLI